MAGTRAWTFRVSCELADGETVCLVGSGPQLGSWALDGALEMEVEPDATENGTTNGAATQNGANGATETANGVNGASSSSITCASVSTVTVPLAKDSDVCYRYCVCVVLNSMGERKLVTRRWETDISPRRIPASVLRDESVGGQLDRFGHIRPVRHVDRGWLNAESVIQLKLYNNPVQLWKRKLTRFRIKVSSLDLSKKNILNEPSTSIFDQENSLDIEAIRTTPTWPIMELAVMADGETSFRSQERFGREYCQDDFFTFQCQALRPNTIGFLVDLYNVPDSPEATPELLGFCHILPKNLSVTNGTLHVPIAAHTHEPIGQMTVDYLVVRPMEEVKCDMEVSYARYWKEAWRGLDVGHRGAGNSFSNKGAVCANIRENTIASMKQAIAHGADMIEFDVQLSKDLVPLIYHDFEVGIALRKRDLHSGHHILDIPLKTLEYSQLLQLQTYHVKESTMGSEHLENDSLEDHRAFPTLEQAFEALDPHVGFNIEIKWTMQLKDGSYELDHPFELNAYIDNILRVVLAHSCQRKIIFSCFHPDICTMLRLKQNRYPVLFLTQGETDQWPPYMDARCQTFEMALLFAQSAQLLGVNVFTAVLLQKTEFIQRARRHGIVVFCWGDENSDAETIRHLKSVGCDAIIYDRLEKYCTKDTKESIFLIEARQAADSSDGSV